MGQFSFNLPYIVVQKNFYSHWHILEWFVIKYSSQKVERQNIIGYIYNHTHHQMEDWRRNHVIDGRRIMVCNCPSALWDNSELQHTKCLKQSCESWQSFSQCVSMKVVHWYSISCKWKLHRCSFPLYIHYHRITYQWHKIAVQLLTKSSILCEYLSNSHFSHHQTKAFSL